MSPAGTTAVMLVAETTVNTAGVPLNFTDVAPVKFAPLMVTLVPARPLVGLKLVMRGATVNVATLVTVPPVVVTEMVPDSAAGGTIAVIWVALSTVKTAVSVLNFTAVAPMNAVPVITTA